MTLKCDYCDNFGRRWTTGYLLLMLAKYTLVIGFLYDRN